MFRNNLAGPVNLVKLAWMSRSQYLFKNFLVCLLYLTRTVFNFLFNWLILLPKTPCNWPIPDTKIQRFWDKSLGWFLGFQYTGCLILLATSKFPYVPESKKKHGSWTGHPMKWLSSGLATPKKWQSPQFWWVGVASSGLFHFLGVANPGLGPFRGWPVHDCGFFWILARGWGCWLWRWWWQPLKEWQL